MTDKLACVSCRHFAGTEFCEYTGTHSYCKRDELLTFDPVNGHRYSDARWNRRDGAKCGPQAWLYEPRDPWWQRPTVWAGAGFAAAVTAFIGVLVL